MGARPAQARRFFRGEALERRLALEQQAVHRRGFGCGQFGEQGVDRQCVQTLWSEAQRIQKQRARTWWHQVQWRGVAREPVFQIRRGVEGRGRCHIVDGSDRCSQQQGETEDEAGPEHRDPSRSE